MQWQLKAHGLHVGPIVDRLAVPPDEGWGAIFFVGAAKTRPLLLLAFPAAVGESNVNLWESECQ